MDNNEAVFRNEKIRTAMDDFFSLENQTLDKGEYLNIVRDAAGCFKVVKSNTKPDLLSGKIIMKVSNVALKEYQENIKKRLDNIKGKENNKNSHEKLDNIRSNVKVLRESLGVPKRVITAVKHLFAKRSNKQLSTYRKVLDTQNALNTNFKNLAKDSKCVKKLTSFITKAQKNDSDEYKKYCSKEKPLTGNRTDWIHYPKTKKEVKFLLDFINIALESTELPEKPAESISKHGPPPTDNTKEILLNLKSNLKSIKYNADINKFAYGDTDAIGNFAPYYDNELTFSNNLNSLLQMIHQFKS